MEELEKYVKVFSPMFINLYHIVLEKIRKFYHEINGLARFSTSKVEKLYTNEKYRLSYNGFEIPEQTFIEMYLNACYDITSSNKVKLEKVKELWNYAKRDIPLENTDYPLNSTLDILQESLEKLDENTAKEYVSIINNRMEKLEKCVEDNSLMFTHLYHLTIEKIRKFYYGICGISIVSATKVERIYTDEKYRLSYNVFEGPEQTFLEMYLDVCYDITSSNEVKLEKVKALWNYAKRDIELGQDYRILIRSRNI